MPEADEWEWHEVPPAEPAEMELIRRGKKLRLLADESVPTPLIDELRANHFNVESVAERGLASHPDENVLEEARRRGKVLLTMDRDFWDDRRTPLTKSPGIIFVDVSPDRLQEATDALAFFLAFMHQPHDWWMEMKVRAKEGNFTVKMRTYKGITEEWEYRLANSRDIEHRRIR